MAEKKKKKKDIKKTPPLRLRHVQSLPTFHCYDFVPPLSPFPPLPPSSLLGECLALLEARHGEGPGESFHAVPQLRHASDRLRVLNQEVLEVLELA